MSHSRARTRMLYLIAAGTVIRVAFAFITDGNGFDLRSYAIVREELLGPDPFALYSVTDTPPFFRWPYAPGFMPFIIAAEALDRVTGIAFETAVRFPAIAADAAIAWIVFTTLLRRAGSAGRALAGGALVALGPSFIAISGHHGQIDSLAVLPAVLAVVAWDRWPAATRAPVAGVLVGVAIAIKTVPGLALLALLPHARDRREVAWLLVGAAAIPAILLAPFLAVEPAATIDGLTYRGLPGLGGISMLAQPDLAFSWLGGGPYEPSSLTDTLQSANRVLVPITAGVVFALALRHRPEVALTASALALAVLVAGVNFSLGYAVWALPFLLLGGYLRETAALQALLVVPALLVYTTSTGNGWSEGVVYGVYVPLMAVVLAAFAAGLVRLCRTMVIVRA